MRPTIVLLSIVLLSILLFLPAAWAQFASGPEPERVADEAVEAWLEQPAPDLMTLASLPPEEVCESLPDMLTNPPAREGTHVNLDDRRELPTETPDTLLYSYPATLPDGSLQRVEVTLLREGEVWEARKVSYRIDAPDVGIPDVFQTPLAGWLFVAFSLYLVYLTVRPTFFRRWLAEGWAAIRRYRGLVIGTVIALYGLFGLGALTGANLPEACAVAVSSFLETSLEELGATQAYESANIPRAAVVTTYQNFVMGTLVTTFGPAVLFGIPAYLFNGFRFFALAIPFGFLEGITPLSLLFVLILILVELMAYVLVTAGGGMFLMTLIRKGFSGFQEGFRNLALMLPIALVLLVIGAWYEATVIILPALLARA